MADSIANTAHASAFDAFHPPSTEIIDKCVHCGFCLPVCPTYVMWGEEMDSPRGRIYLMKLAGDGVAEMNSKWVSHFDSCLGCMACMTACPSGVDYGKLIGLLVLLAWTTENSSRPRVRKSNETPSARPSRNSIGAWCWKLSPGLIACG